jgi:hypothetical protein
MAEAQFSQPNVECINSHKSPLNAHKRSQIVLWQVDKLRPHPRYARLGITVHASRLNSLLEAGEDAFLFPLLVTSKGIVIDGYARLEAARLQGRAIVECLEYDISEQEALRRLLVCHRPSPGLTPFTRIAMARDLAESFIEKAQQHQQDGGRGKGSSKLTEAEKIDVRKKIAEAAGVSTGTCSHALQLIRTADPEIVRALCNGEIKIDRAWRWSKKSRSLQRENLQLYRRHRGMERVAERLIARQVRKLKSRRPPAGRWKNVTFSQAISRLSSMTPELLGPVDVIFIKTSLPIMALSEDVAQRLGFRKESPPCNQQNR